MSFAYLPLFTGDYLRDTRHLSPCEHGIYLLLLMYCWDQKAPVPLDERKIMGICNARSSDEIEAARRVLDEFFVRLDDGHYNTRISQEIARSEAISGKRRLAGLARHQGGVNPESTVARIRSGKARSKSSANAEQVSANAQHVVLSPSPSPSLTLTPTLTPTPKANSDPPLPPFIDSTTFIEWEKTRRAMRAPLTPQAKKLAIRKLTNMHERGIDPNQALEQSTLNGWRGLFDPDPGIRKKQTVSEKNAEAISKWLSHQTNPVDGIAERVDDD